MQVSIIWLIVGALLLALDVFHLPGLGFLFVGLGAILAGAAVEFRLVDAADYAAQGAVFLISSSLFAILLWRRIKAWRLNPGAAQYSNIVGTEATVAKGGLKAGAVGQVKWSGTLMRARLAEGAAAQLPEGAVVIVAAVEGNVLTVAPKA